MPIISEPIRQIDETVVRLSESFFNQMGSAADTYLNAIGVIGLSFIVLNHFIQFKPLSPGEIFSYMIKFVVVSMSIKTWTHFQPIYELFTITPANIMNAFVDNAGLGSNIGAVYGRLNAVAMSLIGIGTGMAVATTIFTLGFFVPSLVLISCGLAVASAVLGVVMGAKITLGIMLMLAPLMVPAILFKSTAHLFQSWFRIFLAAAITPVIFAITMSLILVAIGSAFSGGRLIGGLVIIFTAFAIVKQVPNIVQGLIGAGASVANALPGANVTQMAKLGHTLNSGNKMASQAIKDGKAAAAASGTSLSFRDRASAIYNAHRASPHTKQNARDDIYGQRLGNISKGGRNVPEGGADKSEGGVGNSAAGADKNRINDWQKPKDSSDLVARPKSMDDLDLAMKEKSGSVNGEPKSLFAAKQRWAAWAEEKDSGPNSQNQQTAGRRNSEASADTNSDAKRQAAVKDRQRRAMNSRSSKSST